PVAPLTSWRPLRSTLFPYTTLFRSGHALERGHDDDEQGDQRQEAQEGPAAADDLGDGTTQAAAAGEGTGSDHVSLPGTAWRPRGRRGAARPGPRPGSCPSPARSRGGRARASASRSARPSALPPLSC